VRKEKKTRIGKRILLDLRAVARKREEFGANERKDLRSQPAYKVGAKNLPSAELSYESKCRAGIKIGNMKKKDSNALMPPPASEKFQVTNCWGGE